MTENEYIPYSVRYKIEDEDLWSLANYLERVMWYDLVSLIEWDEAFFWCEYMSIILFKDKMKIIHNANKEIILEMPRVSFLNIFESIIPELRNYLDNL